MKHNKDLSDKLEQYANHMSEYGGNNIYANAMLEASLLINKLRQELSELKDSIREKHA
ncbi:hypothetical protein UFOVP1082_10 [uncultured Caudovirales phage]|uniref:Uncharacterized protein n=1 Tax=uncultured Caudovirales phage TaxID=2100421 RepID=A0A6J5PEB0_9CAUD|nr:hypothetical protein UFOVP906_47 [uncultured Caudovirales phage]CAB4176256.1 hypothetical protein UFOVP992_14 [uncultured Caudovirales phage]CAB4182989.1 hypothetical protein UFOVP1082_10 [uncultured Caudovirales phage]CAB4198005.1 hypothetical protein UFOVP1322_54 [uncultured Caudovirales phage]CAB4212403.1 hypothetical protein UFOVP1434_17 [uncultured Caudovirales phage]